MRSKGAVSRVTIRRRQVSGSNQNEKQIAPRRSKSARAGQIHNS
jgi:hypothetical protein